MASTDFDPDFRSARPCRAHLRLSAALLGVAFLLACPVLWIMPVPGVVAGAALMKLGLSAALALGGLGCLGWATERR